MRIAKLLSVALIVVFAAGPMIGCKKPADTGNGGRATTQPAGAEKGAPPATKPVATVATVNSKCPIMGNTFNSEKVAPELVREFAGQKVGFCCAGCPEKWDNLSDIEKTAKLAAAMTPAP